MLAQHSGETSAGKLARKLNGSTSDTDKQPDRDAQKTPEVGVVILEKVDSPPPEETIRALVAKVPVVFVTYSGERAQGEAARNAGAVVVKMRGENETPPARSRNAGFRQLRKITPELDYVQFLDGDVRLSDRWLDYAVTFIERRPEIAALDGVISESETGPVNSPAQSDNREVSVTGNNVLIRVKDFVDIGGLRGDLAIADIQDFCLRTRGRGHHIWRLELPMGERTNTKIGLGKWWRKASETGYEHAFCASLHGAPPERYRVKEMHRAVFWGGILPILIVGFAAFVMSVTYFIVPMGIPVLNGAIVLAIGMVIYLIRALFFSPKYPNGRSLPFLKKITKTLALFPECLGVLRFMRSSRQSSSAG